MKTVPPAISANEPMPVLETVELQGTLSLTALWALFNHALAQMFRGRRLMVLSLIYCLPIILAVLFRYFMPSKQWTERIDLLEVEFWVIFIMVPHTLLPLMSLLLASGIIQDEIEEQTLTYLLIRPMPRWSIYVVKWFAAVVAAVLVGSLFTCLASLVFWFGTETPILDQLSRIGYIVLAMAFATTAYTGVFGLLSLLLRRSLLMGFVYILLFEGLLANIPFMVRQFTIIYYERILFLNWTDIKQVAMKKWSFDKLEAHPEPVNAIATMCLIAFFTVLLGSYLFATREFRLKTPEGGS